MDYSALESKLLQMATGHQLAASLYYVTVNKIPDYLRDGPKTAEEVAAAAGLPPRSVFRLLRAMTTSGIFRIENGKFSLTEISELLRSDHERGQRYKVMLAAGDLDVWSRLGEAIELDDALPDIKEDWYLEWTKDEDPAAVFDQAMRSYYVDALAPLLGVYDFGNINTLVDIAGGDGGHLIEILKKYPNMKGIIFDQPETSERAKTFIDDAGLSERCSTVSGDFFKAETIPDNGDAYMLRNIMHNWAEEPCEQILKGIVARMPGDARVLVMEQPLPDKEEDLNNCVQYWGVSPAWWDMLMFMWYGGQERNTAGFENLYKNVGLKMTNVMNGALGTAVYEGMKA